MLRALEGPGAVSMRDARRLRRLLLWFARHQAAASQATSGRSSGARAVLLALAWCYRLRLPSTELCALFDEEVLAPAYKSLQQRSPALWERVSGRCQNHPSLIGLSCDRAPVPLMPSVMCNH